MTRQRLRWLAATLATFLLASCQLSTEAEKATCDAISPKYGNYVEADPALSDGDKSRTHRLIKTWRIRVDLPPLDKKPSEVRWDALRSQGVTPNQGESTTSPSLIGLRNGGASAPPVAAAYHVVLLAGQSNMNGRGTSTKPQSTGSLIWKDTAWELVTPGVNTCDQFLPVLQRRSLWGPEVEFVAQADAIGTPIAIIKLASDASYVSPYPGIGNNWHPSQPGSLSVIASNVVSAALVTLPGVALSYSVVWYQGESEAMWQALVPGFAAATHDVIDLLNMSFPSKPSLIRVAIHSGTIFTAPPASPAVEKVQALQIHDTTFGGGIVQVDDLTLLADNIHLDEASIDALGRRLFKQWSNQ